MNRAGRKRKNRVLGADHSKVCFKPCGIPSVDLEQIILLEDEMEAIRLADYESKYQQEAAIAMGISRTTFSRLVESARHKIADALLHQKSINIKSTDEKSI
ncbi:MAG: DUF134 domain-containing protein [Campylobacterota bacterium]|nr:DUF134 domain-containing protein [Campylobacterota bacterium]